MRVSNLRVCNRENPMGVNENPYFSWIIESKEKGTFQKSYRITIIDMDEHMICDTGSIESRDNAYVSCGRLSLKDCTRYRWTVTVTDNNGNSATETSFFETSLLKSISWKAKWIIPSKKGKKNKPGFGRQSAATLFRREFSIKEVPVCARLYMTCHGIYEAYLNGSKIDDRYFAPEHTVYEKYLCYQTYDITSYLNSSDNVIGIQVGNGWYMGPQTLPNMKKDYTHAVLFQMELQFADGTTQYILSDENTVWSEGALLSNDLFAGEYYDATKEVHGWSKPGCTAGEWKKVKLRNFNMDNLVSQIGEPTRIVAELSPVLLKSSKDEYILDFGQNIAGFVRMKTHAKAGTKITLEHCEVLDKNGCYFNNIMSAGGVGKGVDQKDVYICKGENEVYQPHFTYHGFRYVRVTGIIPDPSDFIACALSTEKQQLGSFETDREDINKLYQNICWSQRSNMLSIPTDCPQREKAGWTGDMLVYARTAMQNEECTNLFTRWLENMECDQDEYGIIPMVVPQDGNYPLTGKIMMFTSHVKGSGTSAGWGDAAVIVPYQMYLMTGNREILKKQYYCMRRWCDYIISQAKERKPKGSSLPLEVENYLWDTGYHYGEWLIPSQSKNGLDMKHLKEIMQMSSCYTAPIFGWYSVKTFSEICKILTESEAENALYESDCGKYAQIAAKMKTAIQKGVIREDGSMPSELMGAYVLPIYFDLVPEEHRKVFSENLVTSLEKNQMHMDTGFLATPFLLDALCKINRKDLAYKLLYQTECPSWLYEVKAGGTTMWENCFGYDEDGNPGNLSFNHYSFGAVADWIFRNVGGIYPVEEGYRKIRIEPDPECGVHKASRSLISAQGKISCSWKIEGDNLLILDVTIPCNTEAEIVLPDGTKRLEGSGEYHYDVKLSVQ